MDKEFLTVDEMAELLSVKPVTIYRMAARGAIPVYQVGRVKRFKRSDVDKDLKGPAAGRRSSNKSSHPNGKEKGNDEND